MENQIGIQIFHEIENHLYDPYPSEYFNEMKEMPLFRQYPLSLLTDLEFVHQSPKFHPEGNVWNHTMMVIDEAVRVKNQSHDERVFLWAALLHDIGKKAATKSRDGRITAYDHDKIGAELAKKFLEEFTGDVVFIQKVAALVKWHMQILFVVKSLKFADIKAMKLEVDVREVALLGYCDRMGRLGADQSKEKENIRLFLEKCGLPPLKIC